MADTIKIPKQITTQIYVTLGIGRWNSGNISINDYFVEDDDIEFAKLLLTTTEITIDLPQDIDVDAKGKFISILEKKKEGLQASFHMQIKEVQDQIDNLLAIEYKPEGKE